MAYYRSYHVICDRGHDYTTRAKTMDVPVKCDRDILVWIQDELRMDTVGQCEGNVIAYDYIVPVAYSSRCKDGHINVTEHMIRRCEQCNAPIIEIDELDPIGLDIMMSLAQGL